MATPIMAVPEQDKPPAEATTEDEKGKARRTLARRLTQASTLIQRHVSLTQGQADAQALIAAQTYAASVLVTQPRLLIVAEEPESGKSVDLRVVKSLCDHPVNAAGTWFDTQSAIFDAHARGEECPPIYRDEISEIFGRSGYNGAGNPIGDMARRGYVRGETLGRSRNGMPEKASIFSTFIMAGLRTAVPYDIRTRCVVISMKKGRPREYFDARDAEMRAIRLGESLGHAVKALAEDIGAFRVSSLHKYELTGTRRGEVWEGMFAVAAAAGQEWLNRCMAAFFELAAEERELVKLSPDEELIRDMAEAVNALAGHGIRQQGHALIAGALIRDELRAINPVAYAQLPATVLGRHMADALSPLDVHRRQVRQGDKMIPGYWAHEVLDAWEEIRPRPMDDVRVFDDDDIWAELDI